MPVEEALAIISFAFFYLFLKEKEKKKEFLSSVLYQKTFLILAFITAYSTIAYCMTIATNTETLSLLPFTIIIVFVFMLICEIIDFLIFIWKLVTTSL